MSGRGGKGGMGVTHTGHAQQNKCHFFPFGLSINQSQRLLWRHKCWKKTRFTYILHWCQLPPCPPRPHPPWERLAIMVVSRALHKETFLSFLFFPPPGQTEALLHLLLTHMVSCIDTVGTRSSLVTEGRFSGSGPSTDYLILILTAV